jgi:hypothetical protein
MPVLLAGLLAGCGLDRGSRSGGWLERLRQFGGVTGDDVVMLDIVLLERPAGDAFIDREVWATTDEQVIPLAGKARLEDNGFRVGQVGGIVPPGLQGLLTSERANANPRRRQCRANTPTVLTLSPAHAQCRFTLKLDGQATPVSLDQGVCSFQVTPTQTDDNRVKLSFVPQVQYGSRKYWPAADEGGWSLQGQRPIERYAQLGWDISLAPNEYVVIGTTFAKPESLGYQSFVALQEANPVQRLLVIRAGAMAPAPFPAAAGGDVAPLAMQATYTSARGSQR